MAAAASFVDGDVVRNSTSGGALGVHAASRKIGKTPAARQQQRKPVIIYMVSPKIIHVEAHEFMSLVQRLTGPEAAASGDKKTSPSPSSSSPRRTGTTPPPVRVKARALNRPAGGAAVSVSVTATRQHQQQQLAPPSSSSATAPSPSGFLFHDLSPLRGGAFKVESAAAAGQLVSPASMSWLHHVAGGDHFFSPVGAPASLGSPSAFLDIFGPLPSQHQ
uniref:VQ domain-containing protein n=1 Tax=Leersia perrieri TaxID=77586 RepID=A0A0D9WRV6_9ORYZ